MVYNLCTPVWRVGTVRAMGFLMAAGLMWPAVAGAATASVDVTAVHLTSQGLRTELVLSLSAPTQHSVFTLSQPNRIVIDVDDAHLVSTLPAGIGAVANLRSAPHDGTLRLVLDLNTRAMPQSFLRQGASGPEIVVDITTPGAAPAIAAVPSPASAPGPVPIAPVFPSRT